MTHRFILLFVWLLPSALVASDPPVPLDRSILFTENRGQIVDETGRRRSDILYVADAPGAAFYFRSNGVTIVLRQSCPSVPTSYAAGRHLVESSRHRLQDVAHSTLELAFTDASPAVRYTAMEQVPGVSNYYLPHAPSGILGVRSYRRLVYSDLYPGVDLHFEAGEEGLRYRFVLHAGADARRIGLRYVGGNGWQQGNELLVQHASGASLHDKPASSDNAMRIDATSGELRLATGAVERLAKQASSASPLAREFTWSTYLGGTATEYDGGIVRRENGAILVAGNTNSTVGVSRRTPFQPDLKGQIDLFLTLVDSNGEREWATYIGGSEDDFYGGVTMSDGRIVVCGYTPSTDFPVAPDAQQSTIGGTEDLFAIAFDLDGARVWGTYYGGALEDGATGIAPTEEGGVAISGYTSSSDLPGVTGAYGGNGDALVVELDRDGRRRWAGYYGGSEEDSAEDVAVDGDGTIVVTGFTLSSNLPVGSSAAQPTIAGGIDGFIASFASDGNPRWSTYYGGARNDYASAISSDESNGIAVAGLTFSLDFPLSDGAAQTMYAGGSYDAFILSFTREGSRRWGTLYGGAGSDIARDIEWDPSGSLVVAGYTTSVDLRVSPTAPQEGLRGSADAFIARYSSAGARTWGTYFGGTGIDEAEAIDISSNGDVTVKGSTSSTDLFLSTTPIQSALRGEQDAFLLTISLATLSTPSVMTDRRTPLALSPLPARDHVEARYELHRAHSLTITIRSLDGRVVATPLARARRDAGAHVESIDVGALPSGCYILHVDLDEESTASSLVIVR